MIGTELEATLINTGRSAAKDASLFIGAVNLLSEASLQKLWSALNGL